MMVIPAYLYHDEQMHDIVIIGELLAIAAQIADHVPLDVAALLHDEEAAAIQERAQWVTEHRVFPVDNSGRRYPWPLV